ncbi:DUF3592 domain-containing protein [Mesorhizobium sp. M8A.F.Ca.ET.021.01.1.1]|nr:DUF3592 domain-containing protein [Mesorhizobium sp. M8A.F.Ca.ET.021.01.1.1]
MVLYFLIGVILMAAFIIAVSGYVQNAYYKRKSAHWPSVEATVIDRLLQGSEPPDYCLEVRYEFNGRLFHSILRDNLHKVSDRMDVGEKLFVKINPENNSICYLG